MVEVKIYINDEEIKPSKEDGPIVVSTKMPSPSIDPVSGEAHAFIVHGNEHEQRRLWEALHYFQDGDRIANPYAEPIVSSNGRDGRVTSRHVFLLKVLALAAGVTLTPSH